MLRSPTALPAQVPIVAWDERRGVFLIGEDRPEWAAARARYDQLVFEAPPIVAIQPVPLRHRLRRLLGLAS